MLIKTKPGDANLCSVFMAIDVPANSHQINPSYVFSFLGELLGEGEATFSRKRTLMTFPGGGGFLRPGLRRRGRGGQRGRILRACFSQTGKGIAKIPPPTPYPPPWPRNHPLAKQSMRAMQLPL